MIVTVAIAIAAFFLLHATIQSFIVIGPSMEPTVIEQERLLVNKVVYTVASPERGDVIVFRPPDKNQPDYIKRLIALPDDTVEIKSGHVYVNGSQLEEPYINSNPRYNMPLMRVPDDSYFVLGDNRNNSNDSHNGWTIPRQDIVGKVWLRIWPPPKWGTIEGYPLAAQLAVPESRESLVLTGAVGADH